MTEDTTEDHQIGYEHGVQRTRTRLLEWAKLMKEENEKYSPHRTALNFRKGYLNAMNELIEEIEGNQ